jgi:hypothetical protein
MDRAVAGAHGCLAARDLTGVFIAGYSVLDGYAVKVMLLSPILLDWLTNLLRVPFLLPGQLRDRAGFVAAWRTQWRYALVGAVRALRLAGAACIAGGVMLLAMA